MTQREQFEKWANAAKLDTARCCKDAWGKATYLPHIESMWFGWKAAQSQEATDPEIDVIRKQLAEQVELVEKCMAAMNTNADAGRAAEVALSALREQIATSKPVGYVIKNPNGSISLTTLSEYERMEDWHRLRYVPAYLREEIGDHS